MKSAPIKNWVSNMSVTINVCLVAKPATSSTKSTDPLTGILLWVNEDSEMLTLGSMLAVNLNCLTISKDTKDTLLPLSMNRFTRVFSHNPRAMKCPNLSVSSLFTSGVEDVLGFPLAGLWKSLVRLNHHRDFGRSWYSGNLDSRGNSTVCDPSYCSSNT